MSRRKEERVVAFVAAVTCESSGSNALARRRGRTRRTRRRKGRKTTRLLLRPEAATETHQATTPKYKCTQNNPKK
jgi:hypothetical protein